MGEGYSSILVENGRLYTMYRNMSTEYVIAADANDSLTLKNTKLTALTSHDFHFA